MYIYRSCFLFPPPLLNPLVFPTVVNSPSSLNWGILYAHFHPTVHRLLPAFGLFPVIARRSRPSRIGVEESLSRLAKFLIDFGGIIGEDPLRSDSGSVILEFGGRSRNGITWAMTVAV